MSFAVVPEIEVVRCWQRQMESQRKIVTADGSPVEVLYPGRLNDGRGGDFRDAVILLDKDVKRGNIEIHSCTSGWQAHNHHLDPHYNQVVLHVAWQQDSYSTVFLEDGQSIPTIVMDRDLTAMEEGEKMLPCRRSQNIELGNILERLGEIRLAEKVERFKLDLLKMEAAQVFYSRFLEALGYSKNKRSFLDFACRLPLIDLKDLAADRRNRIMVQSVLLGSAGLLPSQRTFKECVDSYVRELEKNWSDSGYNQLMSHGDWEFYKVRPGNNPVCRIIALSCMVFRYQQHGWLNTWHKVLERAVEDGNRVDLGALLRVRGEGYWNGRYDFYLSPTTCNNWLLGEGRAKEMIINVVFPFFKAWGEEMGEHNLVSGLDNLIRRYPPCGTNSIQSHMLSQLKAERGLVNSALRQQGLLYLYQAYCVSGRCSECLLNK
jgi:hypothetical protein